MPDLIRKHFGYSQLWPLRPACSQNQAGLFAGSDFPHPIWFCFSKEGVGHTVENRPGSDLDGLARVWLNSSGMKASWCAGIIRPGFWQDATGPLPVSHFQTRFRSSTDGPDLVLADCVRFWPNGSGPEESQCARIIRARFWPNASQPIRPGC